MVFRAGIAGFGAAAPPPPPGPLGRLFFDLMLHRPGLLAPPPPGAHVLRVLLRLPERLARRLLPPPPARTNTTILAVLFCDALGRLQREVAVEADGVVVHDLLRLLQNILSGRLRRPRPLLPRPIDVDQVQANPPPLFHQVFTGLLYAAVGRIQRGLPRPHLRRDRVVPTPPPTVDLGRAGLLHAALARIRPQDHHASPDDESSIFYLVGIALARLQDKELAIALS